MQGSTAARIRALDVSADFCLQVMALIGPHGAA